MGAEAVMDWPSRSIWSRVRWLWLGWRLWWRRRCQGPAAEPIWWPQFERAFWAYAASRASGIKVAETLHSSREHGGRPPLIGIVAKDRSGRLIDAAAREAVARDTDARG
jgi:hypothetical protein